MFLGLLEAAGETDKWMTQPIGGEVYPPEQLCLWDMLTNCVPPAQEFTNCVALTHASWLLNHGVFAPGFSGTQQALALAGSKSLGYELYVSNAVLTDATMTGPLHLSLQMLNTGVAPFYYDWPVVLGALNSSNQLANKWPSGWKLSSILPKATNTVWNWSQANHGLAPGQYRLLLRVQNPMTNGLALRFANAAQNADLPGWLTLGQFAVAAAAGRPTLYASASPSGFEISVSNAVPGEWSVEDTRDLAEWDSLFITNTGTATWSVAGVVTSPARFYRLVRQP
jgi:hypothetical protein